MKTHHLSLPSALLLAACAAQSPPPPPPPQTVTATVTAGAAPEAPVSPPGAAYVEGNGRVIEVPIPGTAAVAISVAFYSGSADDPPGKEGLTALTANLIAEGGSASLSYPELLKALYPMAASVEAYADREQTVFSVLVHKDHVAKLVPILADVIVHPRLPEGDLGRLRQSALNSIEKRLRTTDDENLGKALLGSMMYPAGHPYHHPVVGTVEGLKSITLEDVQTHAKTVFGKKRMVIGLGGAIDAATKGLLLTALGALPDGAPRRALIPAPPALAKNHVVIVKKPAKAVAISIGQPHGSYRGHPDFHALAAIQSYFGEHRQFHGVLMSEMREKRGLNYGDYAYVESFIQEGWERLGRTGVGRRRQHFETWIRPVDPKDAVFSLRMALFFRDRLIKEGVPAQGLKDAQQFLEGYTRLWDLTPLRKVGYALDEDFYGTPNYLGRYREALKALTTGDLMGAIKGQLSQPGVSIAIVAEDAEGLKSALISGTKSVKTYGATVDPSVLALDQQLGGFPLGLTESDIEIVRAEDLFQR